MSEWYINADEFTALFEQLNSQYGKILIRVHSQGGDVMEGNVIYGALLASSAEVTIRIEGLCASMMSIVMLGAARIEMADNALLMIHAPSCYCGGNAADMEATGKALRLMEETFSKRYAEKTGKSAEEVAGWLDGTDHWFGPEEALALGLIDAVIPAVVKNVKALDKPQPGTEAVAIYNRYTALLKEDNPNPTKNQPDAMKELLITALGLTGVTKDSPDAEFVAALQAKIQASASATNAPTAQAEAVLSAVEKHTGKPFEAMQRTTLIAIGEKVGLDAMSQMMATAAAHTAPAATPPAAPSILDLMKGLSGAQAAGAEDRSRWSWDDYQKHDPEALAALDKTDFTKFSAIYKAKFGADAPR